MDDSPKPAVAAAMLPDSTQSGNVVTKRKNTKKRKKKDATGRKKKLKDGETKVQKAKAADDSSIVDDLDLSKPLFAIGHYISDREEMLQQAFHSVSKEQIDAMMPDVLQDCPMELVKALCLGQLEGMSKKRIFHVLDGEEMLSSSDTDESEMAEALPQDQSQPASPEEHGGDLKLQTDGFEPQIEEYDPLADGFELQMEDALSGDPMTVDHPPESQSRESAEFEHYTEGDAEMDRQHDSTAVTPEPQLGTSPQLETSPQLGTSLQVGISPVYILDSDEEVDEGEAPPFARRRKKKKDRKPRLINPLDLEEGEVSMESSEYTDASDNDVDVVGAKIGGALTGTDQAEAETVKESMEEAGAGIDQGQKGTNDVNVLNVMEPGKATQTVTASEGKVDNVSERICNNETVTEMPVGMDNKKMSGMESLGLTNVAESEPSSAIDRISNSNQGIVYTVNSSSEMSDSNADILPRTKSTNGRTPFVVCEVSSSEMEEICTEDREINQIVRSVVDSVIALEMLQADQSTVSVCLEPTDGQLTLRTHSVAPPAAEEDPMNLHRGGLEVIIDQTPADSQNNMTDGAASCDQETEELAEVQGDSLSVNNDSDFDEERSESMSPEDSPANQASAKKGDCTDSDHPFPGSNSVEQHVESDPGSGEEKVSSDDDQSASNSGDDNSKQSTPANQDPNAAGVNVEPKLNILELELRARAIRSLMKHCAAVEKLT